MRSWYRYALRLTALLVRWAAAHRYLATDSSTGFKVRNDVLSPDGALPSNERYATLAPQEREPYAPIVPNVAIELASKSRQHLGRRTNRFPSERRYP
jgi:Uma2 family endonuclease